ncbi:MAG: hypothetical protein K2H89_01595 [Oscillospiraceae bacterium]|nr:hypothetical protein [Oscillospiraceae bacterium]
MIIEEHAKLELFLPGLQDSPITIPEEDIIQNSLTVTSQCVNGNVFAFGCVSPAQLSVKFRLKNQNIGRYDVYGAAIILYSWFGEHPPENTSKRGVFNVTVATKKDDIFTISAVDNICLLDTEAFTYSGNAVYQQLEKLSEEGKISFWNAIDALGEIVMKLATPDFWGKTLGFYARNLDCKDIPNSFEYFGGYGASPDENGNYPQHTIRQIRLLPDEQPNNIRDYVAWLAEYMGGFVQADQNGGILFCPFENPWICPKYPWIYGTETPKILDYSEFEQNTLEIAGFRIFLNSARFFTEDRTYNYYTVYDDPCFNPEHPENLINTEIVIENNPFIEYIYNTRFSSSEDGNMKPIMESLCLYQRYIQIRPFSGTYHGNEYLHPGQYIKITDKDGMSYGTTITNITWKFRGGQQIKCIGEDTRTLSQARKRSQATRMGERLKTQINRTESNLRTEMGNVSGNVNNISENQNAQWNAIQDQQEQIDALWNALNGG